MLSGYSLINAASGLVLDDPAFSAADGTPIDQWQYNGGTNQQWFLNPLPDGNYQIMNVFSGNVLDDPASSTAWGTSIIQFHPDGGLNQEWSLVPLADGNDLIVNAASGLVLDDPAFSTANGTTIDQWPYNGGANQEWTLFLPNDFAGTSNNWSGYVAATNLSNPQYGSVSAVNGSWIVPTVTGPSSGTTDSSIWVGIDGNSNSTVEQIGTEQGVVNGTPFYQAWWEMYSTNGANVPGGTYEAPISGMTIQPGDSISASVQFLTSGPNAGQFDLSIVDSTQNESFSINVSSINYQSPEAQLSEAEWVVEAPGLGNNNVANLANFGEVTFTGASAVINNVYGPIDASSWQSTALDITGNASTNDTTSVLNDWGPAGGSSFMVLANSTSFSGAASATNVGTATGTGPAVGVTLQSGTRTGAPAIGGLVGDGTLSRSRYGTLIGQRGRPAQGLSSDLAALDAVFADYDAMEYHLMSGGRRRERVLGGPTSTGE